MNLVNLCGHEINLVGGTIIPASGTAIKVNQKQEPVGEVAGTLIYEMKYLNITGMPEVVEDTLYVVPSPVLNGIKVLYPERTDFIATNKAHKDAYGKTIACQSFRING